MAQTLYTSAAWLAEAYGRLGCKLPVRAQSPAAFAVWQQAARAKLADLMSLHRLPPCPPIQQVYETMTVAEDYVRERGILQTLPGVFTPFFLLRRGDAKGARPAVILPPPDGAGKFGVIWSDDYAKVQAAPAKMREVLLGRWRLAFDLADAGFLVLCPDLPGTGECREWMDWGEASFFKSSRRALNNAAIGLGLSLAGINVHILSRLCDWLGTRNDFDGRVAAWGEADAGMAALYFAAVDTRVGCVCLKDTFCGARARIRSGGGDASGFVPSLWRWLDDADLGALIAPRTLLLVSTQSGEKEDLKAQVALAAPAFAAAGAPGSLVHLFEGEDAPSLSDALRDRLVDWASGVQ